MRQSFFGRGEQGVQHLELQLDALNKAGCEIIYQEKMSGASATRPELAQPLSRLRTGDTVYIYKLDRLGRSLRHLLQVVGDLQQHDLRPGPARL